MIYLLEDDDNIRELVLYALRSANLDGMGFALPSAFWSALEKELPQLIILDIMLPEEDGLSVLKKLRGDPKTHSLPVLMLTAKSTELDQIVGLDAGADDYVAKPFGVMVLLSRVRALLRRTTERGVENGLSFGDLEVDETRHTCRAAGRTVELTRKEFELLVLLLRHPGVVFTRDQLLNEIWGYAFDGESRTVDVHVAHLRQKLGESGKYIGSVRGIGYRMGKESA